MSSSPGSARKDDDADSKAGDPNPPTIALFSPVTLSHASSANKQRSTILVHQKSPLLIATPPQITRALAYSHPFLLPLNKFVGLLTWTSGDPWESFLLVAGFWAVVLYGDALMRYAGPLVVVIGLILGMYARRYSPLSSTGWTGEKQKKGHTKNNSEATNMKHQKTLDEIVETLKIFTSRCNVLLDPLLQLTDFLSTQRTATTATTRPALTTLFIRILLVTPLWVLLTLRPLRIITTKRIALATGTIFLTWHSRPATVSRTILWRSALVRRICAVVTGLHFTDILTAPSEIQPTVKNGVPPPLPPRQPSQQSGVSLTAAAVSEAMKRRPDSTGVRFTFILYENQRRWMGLGWTTSMFAYERAAWTDEHLNAAPAKEEFELPDVEDGATRWRWIPGSQWLVEGAKPTEEGGSKAPPDATDGGLGWIYYDNKVCYLLKVFRYLLTIKQWQNGRRGVDGWGRYTRRRKWYRDAELVEITPSTEITPSPTPTRPTTSRVAPLEAPPPEYSESASLKSISEEKGDSDVASVRSSHSKTGSVSSTRGNAIGRGSLRRRGTGQSSLADEDDRPHRRSEADWGIGDDARMGLE